MVAGIGSSIWGKLSLLKSCLPSILIYLMCTIKFSKWAT